MLVSWPGSSACLEKKNQEAKVEELICIMICRAMLSCCVFLLKFNGCFAVKNRKYLPKWDVSTKKMGGTENASFYAQKVPNKAMHAARKQLIKTSV